MEVAAGALLLGGMLAAPWLSTPLRDTTARRFEVFAVVGVVVWVLGVLLSWRPPRIPLGLAGLVAALVAWTTLLTQNARARYNGATHTFVAITRPVSWLPGSVDHLVSARATAQIATGLVVTLVLIDLARRPLARRIALWALALNGAVIGVIGALGRADVFTPYHHPKGGGTPFGPFGYHGNAAAYLDLALPAALVLVAGCRKEWPRFAALALTALILVGAATNASKAGLGAAVAIVLVFAAVGASRGSHSTRTSRVATKVGVVVVILVVAAGGAFASRHRWSELPDELGAHNGRAAVWRVAGDTWDMHVATGSGPGSFKLLLPSVALQQERQLFSKWVVTDYTPGQPVTIWMVADNDPLQTLAELGVIGTVLLAGILLWPVARGFRSRSPNRFDRTVKVGGLIALGALYLHMLIDAPLQIFAIQLTAGLWAAIVIGTADSPTSAPAPAPAGVEAEDATGTRAPPA